MCVVPAKAGTQGVLSLLKALDSRLRGNDKFQVPATSLCTRSAVVLALYLRIRRAR